MRPKAAARRLFVEALQHLPDDLGTVADLLLGDDERGGQADDLPMRGLRQQTCVAQPQEHLVSGNTCNTSKFK